MADGDLSPHWQDYRAIRRPPRLIPMFSSSCKAFALQTCRDIHPCRTCKGDGYVDDDNPMNPLHRFECQKCRGTGVAAIPRNFRGVCMACHKSGKDHLRVLQRPSTPPPNPIDPPSRTASPSETLAERRRRLSPEKDAGS